MNSASDAFVKTGSLLKSCPYLFTLNTLSPKAVGVGVGIGVGVGVAVGVGIGVGVGVGLGGVGVGVGIELPPIAARRAFISTPGSVPSLAKFLYGLVALSP